MKNKKDIDLLIESFVREERNTTCNPFLSTRIMVAMEKKGSSRMAVISPVWRTLVVATSLLVAVVTGISTGGLYQSKNNNADIVLMNDDRMEKFGLFNEIGN